MRVGNVNLAMNQPWTATERGTTRWPFACSLRATVYALVIAAKAKPLCGVLRAVLAAQLTIKIVL